MLRIEKTLKELRDLQNTLRELGVEMSLTSSPRLKPGDSCRM